ncbi:MAG: NAD(P)H-hydrate dehydratase [Bacteroidota bacterium]
MKILSPSQVRALDQYTIENEPIKSIDLMERASSAFVKWFIKQFPDTEKCPIKVFCGPRNNGGDGLAIARLLNRKYYGVTVYVCQISSNQSPDFKKNLKRLPSRRGVPVIELRDGSELPTFEKKAILIDAIFGSGLSRPVTGYWATLLEYLNQQKNTKVAVDIPSGLFAEKPTTSTSILADYTLSFELPKLAFLLPENQDRVGKVFIQPIGLHPTFIRQEKTDKLLITKPMVASFFKKRAKFSHKGTFGHALLWMGSKGKIGAAVLATKACLRSGAGLTTVYAPECGYNILQISCPEAMTLMDKDTDFLTNIPDLTSYKAIGLGCGIGQTAATEKALFKLIQTATIPLVVDADALNLLAKAPEALSNLPANSILTPHPKEFERLFGKADNDFDRLVLLKKQATQLNCIIVLKGANTCIAMPNGNLYFNSTGNPGMAAGGSGDVLTGILTGLLAQGYSPKEAAILGVYLHGVAGDKAAEVSGQAALIAGDLVTYLGKAMLTLGC